jgi:hypothetical protein
MNLTRPALPASSQCYSKTSQGLVFGISFAVREERRVMAPYAYLTHVEMTDPGEVAFVYSFGVFRIRGRKLAPIYEAAHRHELTAVWRGGGEDDTVSTHVADILFKKIDDEEE